MTCDLFFFFFFLVSITTRIMASVLSVLDRWISKPWSNLLCGEEHRKQFKTAFKCNFCTSLTDDLSDAAIEAASICYCAFALRTSLCFHQRGFPNLVPILRTVPTNVDVFLRGLNDYARKTDLSKCYWMLIRKLG